jgi:hypothetical protein
MAAMAAMGTVAAGVHQDHPAEEAQEEHGRGRHDPGQD